MAKSFLYKIYIPPSLLSWYFRKWPLSAEFYLTEALEKLANTMIEKDLPKFLIQLNWFAFILKHLDERERELRRSCYSRLFANFNVDKFIFHMQSFRVEWDAKIYDKQFFPSKHLEAIQAALDYINGIFQAIPHNKNLDKPVKIEINLFRETFQKFVRQTNIDLKSLKQYRSKEIANMLSQCVSDFYPIQSMKDYFLRVFLFVLSFISLVSNSLAYTVMFSKMLNFKLGTSQKVDYEPTLDDDEVTLAREKLIGKSIAFVASLLSILYFNLYYGDPSNYRKLTRFFLGFFYDKFHVYRHMVKNCVFVVLTVLNLAICTGVALKVKGNFDELLVEFDSIFTDQLSDETFHAVELGVTSVAYTCMVGIVLNVFSTLLALSKNLSATNAAISTLFASFKELWASSNQNKWRGGLSLGTIVGILWGIATLGYQFVKGNFSILLLVTVFQKAPECLYHIAAELLMRTHNSVVNQSGFLAVIRMIGSAFFNGLQSLRFGLLSIEVNSYISWVLGLLGSCCAEQLQPIEERAATFFKVQPSQMNITKGPEKGKLTLFFQPQAQTPIHRIAGVLQTGSETKRFWSSPRRSELASTQQPDQDMGGSSDAGPSQHSGSSQHPGNGIW